MKEGQAVQLAILKKYGSADGDEMGYAFVMMYVYRPQTASIYYEDMIKTCHFFGAPIVVRGQQGGDQTLL